MSADTLFTDTGEPSAAARWDDSATSWHAASTVRNINETRLRILALLSTHGVMTDERIAQVYAHHYPDEPVSPSGLRSRRAELVCEGKVRKQDNEGRTAALRPCSRWALTTSEATV